MAKNKKTIIPPSLQPRKATKKAIPGTPKTEKKKTTPVKKTKSVAPSIVKSSAKATPLPSPKVEKKRFTLWLQEETFRAFKVHVAMSGGSASEYIESLIRNDLKL